MQEIESAYSIRIQFLFGNLGSLDSHSRIHASPPRTEDADRYLEILRTEVSELPTQLLRCGEVRAVALVSELSVGGTRLYAFPARKERTLVLDVGDSSMSVDYLRWTFHHELFHLIDFSADELLRFDPEWGELNPKGFRYGPGGDRVYHDPSTAYRWDKPPPGFVTLYATMGAEEDKAETFAAMMAPSAGARARLSADAVLRAKLAMLKSRLAKICSEADFHGGQ